MANYLKSIKGNWLDFLSYLPPHSRRTWNLPASQPWHDRNLLSIDVQAQLAPSLRRKVSKSLWKARNLPPNQGEDSQRAVIKWQEKPGPLKGPLKGPKILCFFWKLQNTQKLTLQASKLQETRRDKLFAQRILANHLMCTCHSEVTAFLTAAQIHFTPPVWTQFSAAALSAPVERCIWQMEMICCDLVWFWEPTNVMLDWKKFLDKAWVKRVVLERSTLLFQDKRHKNTTPMQ